MKWCKNTLVLSKPSVLAAVLEVHNCSLICTGLLLKPDYLLLLPSETDDLPSIDSDSEIEEENSASKEHIDFLNPVAVSMFYLYIGIIIVHILKCFHINFKRRKHIFYNGEKYKKKENFGWGDILHFCSVGSAMIPQTRRLKAFTRVLNVPAPFRNNLWPEYIFATFLGISLLIFDIL